MRFRLPISLFALITADASLALAPAAAQPAMPAASSDMVDRFYRGREVVRAAVKATGGEAAIRGIKTFAVRLDGDASIDVQGYRPTEIGHPVTEGLNSVDNRFDLETPRFYQRIGQQYRGGYDGDFLTLWDKGTSWTVRMESRDVLEQSPAPSPYGAGGAFMVASRWLPPLILQRALQNFRSVAWIGESDAGGGPADVVEFSFDEATRFRIHVSRGDRLIKRVDAMAPDQIVADDTSIALLSGSHTFDGLIMPQEILTLRRGARVQHFRLVSASANRPMAAEEFAPPADFTKIAVAGGVQTKQIAGNVYEVSGLSGATYHVPFVVMRDFVVAYEAPLGIAPTRQVIAEIRKVAGDKPIKYVVISHFHADHAGGIGAYAEIGATVLSAAGNRQVLEQYARNNRPQFQGAEGPRPELQIAFQAVPDKGMEIADAAGAKLRIVNFAGTGHVDNMLALVDPAAGVFMGADHHIGAVRWNPTFTTVARWIERNRNVQWVLGVHDRPLDRATYLARAKASRSTGAASSR